MHSYKISVIVCIYKVEKYLSDCINSIINQTYTNLEIILVNDGSPDNSPKLCDYFAHLDARIKVIHKENGGLSDAKNVGLLSATGDLIIFVDGDDYIDLGMFSSMVNELESTDSDIAICDYYRVEHQGLVPNHYSLVKRIFTGEEASALVLSDKISSHSWNKLCKFPLYKDVKFPLRQTYEDIHETYKIFLNCKQVVYIPKCLYYYRINNDGISLGKNIRRSFDSFLAFKNRLEFAKKEFSEVIPDSIGLACKIGVIAYNNAILSKGNEINCFEKKEIIDYFRDNYYGIITVKSLSIEKKFQVSLMLFFRKLYDHTYKVLRRKI